MFFTGGRRCLPTNGGAPWLCPSWRFRLNFSLQSPLREDLGFYSEGEPSPPVASASSRFFGRIYSQAKVCCFCLNFCLYLMRIRCPLCFFERMVRPWRIGAVFLTWSWWWEGGVWMFFGCWRRGRGSPFPFWGSAHWRKDRVLYFWRFEETWLFWPLRRLFFDWQESPTAIDVGWVVVLESSEVPRSSYWPSKDWVSANWFPFRAWWFISPSGTPFPYYFQLPPWASCSNF